MSLVSVIILTYNSAEWIANCLYSLSTQTILDSLEVIVADNGSTDNSVELAQLDSSVRVEQFGINLGYCNGNNLAAQKACGKWLLFLNPDTFLDKSAIERLVEGVESANAQAGCPRVLDYKVGTHQSSGARGFDVFGLTTARDKVNDISEVLMPEGCAYLVDRQAFFRVGGFDGKLFMYSDEHDLSMRLWIAGYKAVTVPNAKVYHQRH